MSRNKVVQRSTINPFESLINILPCDRPIKSIQLLENYEACPAHFIPLHKTLDSDSDADLFKENILFGKRHTRYLCISKTEGLPNFVLEKLKIIGTNEHLANEGFISIKNTSDTNQKAWRKKQLVYKLSKTEVAAECITDIIILTKFNRQMITDGFQYLGELEKVHICYKVAPVKPEISDFTEQIENLKINSNLYPSTEGDHYYESLQASYQLPISPSNRPVPLRKAPLPPTPTTPIEITNNASNNSNTGTLSHYHNDFIGVPWAVLNPKLKTTAFDLDLPKFVDRFDALEYDFQLERQILCTTKGENRKSSSTNPFF
ncbi:CLUMA_CG005331, isoform A [Clunio marinus]|uniref:CLUMA_CG005331, isoform A n=1 Tax=Clunio marinus TaxID=568069 RepID=A0A1J1HUK6_9DIPT|nr:CLUMA_CG005331, isoform A [Clunio marinus]